MPKAKKLKGKLILEGKESPKINNKPCKDFHLNIYQLKDPTKVSFVYIPSVKYRTIVNELRNSDDIQSFFEILESQKEDLPCNKGDFIFKTIYSNLSEEELDILRNSRQSVPQPKKSGKKYLKVLNKYFKLKSEYEGKFYEKKKKINANNELTYEEKREKITKIKRFCVLCGGGGGSTFINNRKSYAVVCKSKSEPCDGLEIIKRKVDYIPTVIEKLYKEIEKQKQRIIKVKLDFLFNLKDESIVTEEFEAFKKEYNDLNAELVSLDITLEDQQNNQHRKRNIEMENIKLNEMIKLQQNHIKEYYATENKQFLTDAINVYIKDILPIQKNIRELSYKRLGSFIYRGKYHLIQEKNSKESYERIIF